MTQTQKVDQVEEPQPDVEFTGELGGLLHDHDAWREHSNREEARADDVFFQRFVTLGQEMRGILAGEPEQG